MRTAKRVTLLLVVALTLLPAVQGDPTNTGQAPATPSPLSGTRWASCIVIVTADPTIMPLQGGTLQALVLSSNVTGKAAHEVLDMDELSRSDIENLVRVECLSQDSPPAGARPTQPSAARGARDDEPGYDADMLRQMERIYGNYLARAPENVGRDASGPSGDQALTQRASLRLTVELPGGKLAAQEFLQALVENLRTTLLDAYSQRVSELNALLRDVESRRRALETGHSEGTAPDPREQMVRNQLHTIVDLSPWVPSMPVSEAIDVLRNAVDPPLQIVVLWRDLEQNAQIQPSSPIEIEGPSNIELGVALETLLKSLSAGRLPLSYQIKGNVITIAIAQPLGGPAPGAVEPTLNVDVAALAAEKTDLTRKIQALYVDLATQEAREKAISKQIAIITDETARRAAQDEITRELQSLVDISKMNMAEIKKAIDAGRAAPTDMTQAQENLTRARIELARRQEELSKSAGGGQLDAFNKELSQMAVERAGKEAERGVLDQRLADVQRELARAPVYDPAATARMRMIREALDIMERRTAELQTHIANLQPPMVTMIGAN